MTTRVLFIGLDAAEPRLLQGGDGSAPLPFLASLAARGATAPLTNRMTTLPGAIWPELATGWSAGRQPLYYHPKQLRTGEAQPRAVTRQDVDGERQVWAVAGRAGGRVAVVDVPQSVPVPGLGGVQVVDWATHDRHDATVTEPASLLGEVLARFGRHPVDQCDPYRDEPGGLARLRDDLLTGVARKRDLLLELLGREDWDLFVTAFTETHCAGHQFWHLHDASSAEHDAEAAGELGATVREVYAAVDAAAADVAAAAGEDATVVVVASHGMGPALGGPQLLGEALRRMGMGAGASRGARLRGAVPERLRRPIANRLSRRRVGALLPSAGLRSPSTRAVELYNNRCGAVRLNLAGREPHGTVPPDAADALLREIETELRALRDPVTGEPVVREVVRAADAFGADHHADVPDLLVDFRTDLGPLDRCVSERLGLIELPAIIPTFRRTGDHTVRSRLWVAGPGVAPGTDLGRADVLDVAPTLLVLLDVELPATLDGRPLPGVAALRPGGPPRRG